MPTNTAFDILLDGKGYMLARDPQHRGRAWQRSGVTDAVSTQRAQARGIYGDTENYGGLPAEIDIPLVMDDWSGGAGTYYRHPHRPNHYHLGYGIDTRFPGMVFPCQAPRLIDALLTTSTNFNADYFIDVPLRGVTNPPAGAGTVLALGRGYVAAFTPTNYTQQLGGSAFDYAWEASGGGALAFGHRPAIFGSFTYIPNTSGSGFYQRAHSGTDYTLSDKLPARWFRTAAGRMWRGFQGSGAAASGGAIGFQIQSVAIGADPLITANWSATLSIGNGQMVSQDAISCEDRLFVGFPDGLYMGDQTGTFTNVVTDIGENVGADNIRDLTVHNGQIVFATGAHVWGYTPPGPNGGTSVLRQLMPHWDMRVTASAAPSVTSSPFPAGARLNGPVTCLESFGPWLYAGVFTGSNSLVYCGVDASPGLPYVWHPMQFFRETCKISRLHVDAITAASSGAAIPRRIWAATDATFGAQAN